MLEQQKEEKIAILPFKDSYLNGLISPEEILSFKKDLNLKEDLDRCLNESRLSI